MRRTEEGLIPSAISTYHLIGVTILPTNEPPILGEIGVIAPPTHCLARAQREPGRSDRAADRIGHPATRGPPSPAGSPSPAPFPGPSARPGWERGRGQFPPAGG